MKGYYGLNEETYPHVLITPGGIFFNPGTDGHKSWIPQSLKIELPTKGIVDLEVLVDFYLEHNNVS